MVESRLQRLQRRARDATLVRNEMLAEDNEPEERVISEDVPTVG